MRGSGESFGSPSEGTPQYDPWVLQNHEDAKRNYELYNQGLYWPTPAFAPPYPPSMYDHMRTSHFGDENNPMRPQNQSSSGISSEGEEEESSPGQDYSDMTSESYRSPL